ncbi:MAG: hypothetical protein ACRCWJ_17835 [Casimicrobium sp.]
MAYSNFQHQEAERRFATLRANPGSTPAQIAALLNRRGLTAAALSIRFSRVGAHGVCNATCGAWRTDSILRVYRNRAGFAESRGVQSVTRGAVAARGGSKRRRG